MAKEPKKFEYKRLGVKLFKDKDADILDYLHSQTLNQSIIVRLGIRTLQSMYGDTDLLEVIAKGNTGGQKTINYKKKSSEGKFSNADKVKSADSSANLEKINEKVQKKTSSNSKQRIKKKPKRLPQTDLELWNDQNFDNL